jgi:hypothetical protein
MKHGKTAVYTILKNESKYIEKWLYYADPFDYKVLLDTGSTDGSWEMLQEAATKDPKLIIEQKIIDPWHFANARRHNMTKIPKEVTWCLSPDLDEYYSINTHDQMERIIQAVPDITCIACDRLDIYGKVVRVGPSSGLLSTNKIHLHHYYTWNQPIYEHISWTGQKGLEKELYDDEIFLIHDQDFKKKSREELYVRMLKEVYTSDPTNTWCLWFYVYYLWNSKNLKEYIPAACDYVKYHTNKNDKNYKDVTRDLLNLHRIADISYEQKKMIEEVTSVRQNVPFSVGAAQIW